QQTINVEFEPRPGSGRMPEEPSPSDPHPDERSRDS
ncbi:MAG: hypothetical protein JWR58_1570, partial [Pseudonocardia sp.]|nr:hypothetical protein [Pseudonocardia sp.]